MVGAINVAPESAVVALNFFCLTQGSFSASTFYNTGHIFKIENGVGRNTNGEKIES